MSTDVCLEKVDRLRTDFDAHCVEDRETHSDLYHRLDRLPVWASLFMATLSLLLGAAVTAAIMR